MIRPEQSRPPVQLAIVGCGLITEHAHLPAALRSSAVEVVSLVDASVERATMLASKFGLRTRIATDLRTVLDNVEAVLVATPNHTHFDVCRLAVESGKPVLVEKPLTTRYADAQVLCELAERRNTFISVGFMTRHQPIVPFMKELLDRGFFGVIRSFHFQSGSVGGWAPVSGYNLDAQLSGGGSSRGHWRPLSRSDAVLVWRT